MTFVRGRVHRQPQDRAGNLFIALRGENFDGHDFVATASAAGAVAAGLPPMQSPVAGSRAAALVVEPTRGGAGRCRRMAFALRVAGVAVTGSNGKTTSKEMITSIMRAAHGDGVLRRRATSTTTSACR